jgi:hypothetical protein
LERRKVQVKRILKIWMKTRSSKFLKRKISSRSPKRSLLIFQCGLELNATAQCTSSTKINH